MIRLSICLLAVFFYSCSTVPVDTQPSKDEVFVITFGSCNKTELENPFWNAMDRIQPDAFVWLGDNIYADTEDMALMQSLYAAQKKLPDYARFIKNTKITGVWDDHDYGANDAGREYAKKAESQRLFLDFLGADENDPRRKRPGIFGSETIKKNGKLLKILLLDTRYFRSELTKSKERNRRYDPNKSGEGTLLGDEQWQWLENELKLNEADYHIVVSSIQFLSKEHGWEKWGNFPHEVERFELILQKHKPNGLVILSGDRHISEISQKSLPELGYDLVDVTASSLTHSNDNYSYEPNPYRIGNVVSTENYGKLTINPTANKAKIEIVGKEEKVLLVHEVQF